MEKIQKVLDKFAEHGIDYKIIHHPAIYTIEEMRQLGLEHSDAVAKNLFLREEGKKRYFLLTARHDKTINLKAVQALIGCKRLGFASENDLRAILDLEKGSVTPLGVLNDREHRVEVLLDRDILESGEIGLHPNSNTATVWMDVEDLEQLIRAHGNLFGYVDL